MAALYTKHRRCSASAAPNRAMLDRSPADGVQCDDVDRGTHAMAATGKHTNTEFELRGFNHLALVCRDMAETVAWYEDKLGMKLVKTLELPGGRGQHFFLDMGNGVDGIAFFWFPDAPEGVHGESLQRPFAGVHGDRQR